MKLKIKKIVNTLFTTGIINSKLLLIMFFVMNFISVTGQNRGLISGKLISENNESIPFANVSIIDNKSKKLVTGTISDESGKFSMDLENQNLEILVEISAIGFKKYNSSPIYIKSKNSLNLGLIVLSTELTSLGEVTVVGERPKITVKPNKTVVNVENSILSKGSSSLKVLERSPGIYISQDGNFQINGRSGVLVLINGRKTFMGSQDLINYLSSISADNIKSIEIINNPSSKYDAEGVAGIINVYLKTSIQNGINGNLYMGSNYNGVWGYNGGGNVNYRSGKWSFGLTGNYTESGYDIDLNLNREFNINGAQSIFEQSSVSTIKGNSYFSNMIVDFSINENHIIGTNIQYVKGDDREYYDSKTQISYTTNQNDQFVNSLSIGQGGNDRLLFNLHYSGTLDTIGSSISIDLDYVDAQNNFLNAQENEYKFIEDESNNYSDVILTNNSVYHDIFAGKLDYTKAFNNDDALEIGLKSSKVKSDNDQITQNIVNDQLSENPADSENIIYNEIIHAGYVNYNTSIFKKIDLSLGLRTEYTKINSEIVSLDEIINSSYTNFFPSISASYKVNENNELSFNYNKRINRPNYQWLNPSVTYIDPYTLEKGNPYLTPMYSSNFEINNILKKKYKFSFSYSKSKDAFSTVLLQDDENKTTTILIDNLDETNDYGLNAVIPIDLTDWWSMNNTLGISYSEYKSEIESYFLESNQFSYAIQNQHNINFKNGLKMELFGAVYGPRNIGQFIIKEQFWIDIGVSKSIFKEKLNLSLNFSDILKTRTLKTKIDFGNMDTGIEQYNSTQAVTLSVQYNFSGGSKFSLKERSGSSDEQNRIE